jgi:hypothetical protein
MENPSPGGSASSSLEADGLDAVEEEPDLAAAPDRLLDCAAIEEHARKRILTQIMNGLFINKTLSRTREAVNCRG